MRRGRLRQDLIDAIVEAELNADERRADGDKGQEFAEGYAMGLRVAANIAGIKKWGLDPRTRAEQYR